MPLARHLLPDPAEFYAAQVERLQGRGTWRTGDCPWHGGHSLAVNVESGGFCCRNCGVKGGDPLAFLMLRDGLDFEAAARALGAWEEGTGPRATSRPRGLSAADRIVLARPALMKAHLILSDAHRVIAKTFPNADMRELLGLSEHDWQTFVQAHADVARVLED